MEPDDPNGGDGGGGILSCSHNDVAGREERHPQNRANINEGPTEEVWNSHRRVITNLYFGKRLTLKKVMAIMQSEYQFKARSVVVRAGNTAP